ncbi:MAG: hypothetical protein D3926_04240 [Desulfobacteraceae bacterium]|nr:MAG: hypothetical protein D3926_04240 [Desulfobacteraceae bacterium]
MKESLVQTASQLMIPSKEAADEFSKKRESLAAMGSDRLSKRTDIEKLVGQGNQQMAEDNNRNFARFMESLFLEYNPQVFVDTVLWVFRAYRSHGFQTTYWATNLNIWVDLLKSELSSGAFDQIYPLYNWLIINIPIFASLSEKEDPKVSAALEH